MENGKGGRREEEFGVLEVTVKEVPVSSNEVSAAKFNFQPLAAERTLKRTELARRNGHTLYYYYTISCTASVLE